MRQGPVLFDRDNLAAQIRGDGDVVLLRARHSDRDLPVSVFAFTEIGAAAKVRSISPAFVGHLEGPARVRYRRSVPRPCSASAW